MWKDVTCVCGGMEGFDYFFVAGPGSFELASLVCFSDQPIICSTWFKGHVSLYT